MNDFEKAIWDWLFACPHFQQLFFMVVNLQNEFDKETVLTPDVSGEQPEFVEGMEYLDGSGVKEYMCNVAQYINMTTTPNSTENLDAWESIKSLQKWVLSQIKKGDLPLWSYPIEDIKVTGAMQAGYFDGNMKGQFQIIIRYLCEGD